MAKTKHLMVDQLIAAFKRADPGVRDCPAKGGKPGYTHIHGPNQKRASDVPNKKNCTSCNIVIENLNATVSLRKALGIKLGANWRDSRAISETNPTGRTCPDTGHPLCFTLSEIIKDGRTLVTFAEEVVTAHKELSEQGELNEW